MKIAFSTLSCPRWDLDTIVARAGEYGYDGVDFRGLGDELEVYNLPAFTADAAATRRRIEDAGLKVAGFSSSARMFDATDAARADSLDQVKRYAELCARFDAPLIRVFGGRLEGTPLAAAVPIAAETLDGMAAAAAPARIVVETHDDWVATAPLAEVMRRVRAGNVALLWDLHHPYRLAGEAPRESYDNIARFTRGVHVKDSRLNADGSHSPALPGEGDVPLAELVQMLLDGGYDGYFTVEWEKRWIAGIAEPEQALPAYADFLRRLGG